MVSDEAVELDQAWTRTSPARVAREISICGVFDAIVRTYARVSVTGREHLDSIDGPVIFVANHSSHVDTPVLLRSLPGRWRRRTAVTAAADYFYANRLLAAAVSLAFGTVPLERRAEVGRARAVAGLKPLIDSGWSLVVFAEGTRSRDGRVGSLRSGAATLATECGLPIVPVFLAGTHAAMPVGAGWMRRPRGGGRFARHSIAVCFGPPIRPDSSAGPAAMMEVARSFMESCGAETAPPPDGADRRAAIAETAL